MRRTPSPTAAFWLAAFTYFIWGFTFLASRVAQNYGSPFVLLFWRFALAFVLMNLLCLTGRFHVHLHGRDLRPVLLAGLFEPVLYFPCEQYGLKLTSTSFSGVMIALIPLCSLIYGAVFLHEKATRRQVLFSVLSVAGVIVLAVYASGIGAGSLLGFLVLLGTVFAGAGYMVACRACADSFSAFERTYVTCLMGAAAFGVLSLLEHRHDLSAVVQPVTHAPFVLAILFLSVVASVLSYIALNRALEVLPIARTAVLINLSTVVSVLTGVLILHEPFGWISAVASASGARSASPRRRPPRAASRCPCHERSLTQIFSHQKDDPYAIYRTENRTRRTGRSRRGVHGGARALDGGLSGRACRARRDGRRPACGNAAAEQGHA